MEPIIRPFGEQPPAVLERGVLGIVTSLRYERTFSFGQLVTEIIRLLLWKSFGES